MDTWPQDLTATEYSGNLDLPVLLSMSLQQLDSLQAETYRSSFFTSGQPSSYMGPVDILSTSRTSILGFNSTNGEGFKPSPFSNGVPRDPIGWKKSLFTSPGRQKNKNVWKSLGFIMVNLVPREVPQPKTLGASSPQGFGLGTSQGTPFTMIHARLFHT